MAIIEMQSARSIMIDTLKSLDVNQSFDIPLGDKTPAYRRVQVHQCVEELMLPKHDSMGLDRKYVTRLVKEDRAIRVWRVS